MKKKLAIKRLLNKYNIGVLSLMIFYEIAMTTIVKVLGLLIY